ncbi:MAG: site-specific integrase [Frankia sp.]|nr:site-specific integrase [Frankia sp.]
MNQTFRALQQRFAWLFDDDEIDASPMERMTPPKIGTRLVPVLELDQLAALVATCKGRDFVDRRDAAIIRTFADSGGRRSEVARLALADVDLTRKRLVVTGKGDRQRTIAIGNQTALAINRYLRVRAQHRWASLPALWLSARSSAPLTPDGLYQMIVRRGELAGIKIHPHMFRHTLAHEWLDNGGGEQTLADQMGWSSTQMAARYGAIGRANRAAREHERLGLGDRI